jgi:hypothetical protein
MSLEGAGISEYPIAGTGNIDVLARQLNVVRASQHGTDYPGSIYVAPEIPSERWVGYASSAGEALAAWISELLNEAKRSEVRELDQR